EDLEKRNNEAILGLIGDLLQSLDNMSGASGGAAGLLDVGQLAAALTGLGNNPNGGNAVAVLGSIASALSHFGGVVGDLGPEFNFFGKAITLSKSAMDLGEALWDLSQGNGDPMKVAQSLIKVAWDAANLLAAMETMSGVTIVPELAELLVGLGAIGFAIAAVCFLACVDSNGNTPFNDSMRRFFGPEWDSPDGPDSNIGKFLKKFGKLFGDPHLVTFDEHPYDFQAVGEFTLVRSTTDDFEVQVRTAPIAGQAPVSVVVGIAIGVGGHRVTSVDDGRGILIDGAAMSGPTQLLPDGTVVLRDSSGEPSVVLADGTQVGLFNGLLGTALVGLASPRAGAVEGLLGNADDDPDNDLVTADGTVIETNGLDDVRLLAAAWRVTPETSLFDYAPGTDTTTFTDLEAPRAALTISDLDEATRKSAADICRNAGVTKQPYLDSCTLDV
ncbi:MAG: VWD domain-containing protein, partial [Actinomycetota bacterium]|nr:VWD domain-containing protein [Actinomycetota bacterium]